ncbi:ABC transporter permease [Microtetraspora fusca]|uniref:ABC transporter permease n=1 Tax=Microtetraspora fusca TaxID=1997 RepID=UPI000831AC68|nr:ABC transporter permease [Microtetraspora fusca]
MNAHTVQTVPAERRYGLRARLRATARSEWVKLWSVRSAPAVLEATAVVIVVGALVLSSGYRSGWASLSASERAAFDPTYTSLRGIELAQLFVGALGVLAVTSEYGTGLIRATLAATPQRTQVLVVKGLVLGAVVWVVSTASSFGAFALGQRLFTGPMPHAALGDPGVLRAVLGGGLYLTLIVLFGTALGALSRSTPLGLAALFGVLLVLPLMVNLLPGSLADRILPYLPGEAGAQVWHVMPPSPRSLGPWQGFALFALYVVVSAGAVLRLTRRRDV